MSHCPPITPELMSPAGDWDCAKAAVENGADAIYFGLQGGFNARARAANFSDADLPELMAFLHARGVRGYLTLNTLVFNDELEEFERAARRVAAAGVDAVLVQDLGVLRLMHRLCPDLPLHASTQMTLSSAECIREVESLGVRRVVLPRETSLEQIAAIQSQTEMELEVFVHGALCISYSGQCLASLSMGGRSANRGQCAQPCRLPYEVICEGRKSDKPYPLSPHDLAAYDRLPQLVAAGVSAVKIEGRLKPPEYVAGVTRFYRDAIDAVCGDKKAGGAASLSELEIVFSRGFCHGWLDGPNHRELISGQTSAKRGVYLGEVRDIRGERISVQLVGPVRRGDGVVFEGDRSQAAEQGGRVYEVFQRRCSIETEVASGVVELAFRNDSMDMTKIHRGQKVWKTDDPQTLRRLRQSFEGRSQRRVSLDLKVEAVAGRPLAVTATTATGIVCYATSPEPLAVATKHPLTHETLREQFSRLGKTSFALDRLEATIDGGPMIPLSVLSKLRHELVEQLDALVSQPPVRTILESSAINELRTQGRGQGGEGRETDKLPSQTATGRDTVLHVLCRSLEQINAAVACSVSSVIVELRDLNRCRDAVQIVRDAGASALLATPRIHKPGESGVFDRMAKCRPDGILARNLAGLAFFRDAGLPVVTDFSLNVVNDLSFAWLCQRGATRVTAAYDLNDHRLLDLVANVAPDRLEVVVARHTPMFHTEYCLFCDLLSVSGRRADCGRPCKTNDVRLRDRLGVEHVLLADSQCRNTLFHGEMQSVLDAVPTLRQRGVRHFRVELLSEKTVEDVRRTIELCRRVCVGDKSR